MAYLKHDDDKAIELRNQQVLGDESPLEFNDDGFTEVGDQRTAEKLAAMHRHISLGGHGPETEVDEGGEDDGKSLDDMTKEELSDLAGERETSGRSKMNKDELREAIRED